MESNMKNIILLFALLTFSISSNAASISINDSAYGTVYSFESNIDQSSQLLIIGLYETRSDSSFNYHPQGVANVNINYGGNKPITLVVSSYEPKLWNFNVENNVNVSQIILNGYYGQESAGIDGSLIDNRSGTGNYLAACGYSLPYNGGGCDTNYFIDQVENYTGLSLNAFAGAYRATDITITTSTVPIPSALWLFLTGIISFVGIKKK